MTARIEEIAGYHSRQGAMDVVEVPSNQAYTRRLLLVQDWHALLDLTVSVSPKSATALLTGDLMAEGGPADCDGLLGNTPHHACDRRGGALTWDTLRYDNPDCWADLWTTLAKACHGPEHAEALGGATADGGTER